MKSNIKKKKVFIFLPDGGGLRNFVFSSFKEIGDEKGVEIIYWNNSLLRIKEKFGSTTGYFRPPYGSWDKRTLQAAAACGISHVVLWTVSLNGKTITTWDGKIHPGNIVLVHYVRSMAQSIRQLEKRLKLQGLTVARLSDYLN